MEVIKIENLNFSYPNQNKKSLKDINLNILEGELVLICGQSGCGKTTLLRHIKPELTPFGDRQGKIKYYDKNIYEYDELKTSCEIGYVMQNPDTQIVTDKVWHELAFGLENMGMDSPTIRRRVAEMASYFGIQTWFRKNINELSGGQKQLLNLAAIMVMQPKLLILDEPTSQLDPIASKDFLDTIVKINRDLGTTIIITEHQLEDIFPISDKVVVMENGEILCCANPKDVIKELGIKDKEQKISKSLPTPVRIYKEIEFGDECPLTIREGKKWINKIINKDFFKASKIKKNEVLKGEVAIELKNVWFRYDKICEPILRDVSLKVYKNEIYSILGGNGAGKTTTLCIMSNQLKAIKGKILINNKDINKFKGGSLFKENMAVLPQNPQSLFVFNTLKEDLLEIYTYSKLNKEKKIKNVMEISEQFGIKHLLEQHPYDLSGGELQKAAMAKIMLLKPKILLLDEPTKGLDAYSKEEIGELLIKFKNKGMSIIMVTHDIEFSATYSDRCALFFDGNIVSEDIPKIFFANNNFYTTAANRMIRHIVSDAITCEDVVKICKTVRLVKD
ncbi:cobalt ABC transporter ATP-binding protein [Clostridiaceae bacterium 14S0207]|nr:cobalt ABC transporter ATP-binding protein [Clostridiaceae bacterium 14S0207]